MNPFEISTPHGYRKLLPNELRKEGDEFWGGNQWVLCSAIGQQAGVINYIIRPLNPKDIKLAPPEVYISIPEKIEKYLKKITPKKLDKTPAIH
jgi:hypothetical protein